MQYGKLSDSTYLLRLEPGDDILGFIGRFCSDHDITNASISGIGSVESPTLAHYSMHSHQFQEVSFEGVYEITSITGSVAFAPGSRKVHCHVTMSDVNMHAFGGHLVQGKCSALAELFISAFPTKYTKSHNDHIGLEVWDLPSH